jgi:hypothetical protein
MTGPPAQRMLRRLPGNRLSQPAKQRGSIGHLRPPPVRSPRPHAPILGCPGSLAAAPVWAVSSGRCGQLGSPNPAPGPRHVLTRVSQFALHPFGPAQQRIPEESLAPVEALGRQRDTRRHGNSHQPADGCTYGADALGVLLPVIGDPRSPYSLQFLVRRSPGCRPRPHPRLTSPLRSDLLRHHDHRSTVSVSVCLYATA